MNPASVDVKDVLVAAGVGTFAATSGWAIYIGKAPDKPNTTITLYDYGGSPPAPNMLIDEPALQVRVRGNPGGYPAAYSKIIEVRDTLHGFVRQTVNGTHYLAIFAAQDPNLLQYDESNRPIFTLNFEITREPEAGDHRG